MSKDDEQRGHDQPEAIGPVSGQQQCLPSREQVGLDGVDRLRKIGALTLKLAAILRCRLVEIYGDPADADGPFYPPTVEDLARLLDEEIRLADLLEFLRSEAFRQAPSEWNCDPLSVSLEEWRIGLIEG